MITQAVITAITTLTITIKNYNHNNNNDNDNSKNDINNNNDNYFKNSYIQTTIARRISTSSHLLRFLVACC